MKKWSFQVLLVCLVAGAALLVSLSALVGADEKNAPAAYLSTATYIGSAKCLMCHKGMAISKALVAEYAKSEHASFATQTYEVGKTPADEIYRHVTGPNTDVSKWSEAGVTCEACHGPGSAHMKAPMAEKKNVIVNPADLATYGQKVSLCGRCHGQYSYGDKRYVPDYLPGMDLTTDAKFKMDAVKPGAKMDQLNELAQSKHFTKDVACISCHDPHGTPDKSEHQLLKPVVELCTSCHKDKTMAAHAPTAAAGSTCATCHMKDGSHTFAVPAK